MTNQLTWAMMINGVWRVISEDVGPRDMVVYVPKTSLAKAKVLVDLYGHMNTRYEVKELHNPLKFKKYTYKRV